MIKENIFFCRERAGKVDIANDIGSPFLLKPIFLEVTIDCFLSGLTLFVDDALENVQNVSTVPTCRGTFFFEILEKERRTKRKMRTKDDFDLEYHIYSGRLSLTVDSWDTMISILLDDASSSEEEDQKEEEVARL